MRVASIPPERFCVFEIARHRCFIIDEDGESNCPLL